MENCWKAVYATMESGLDVATLALLMEDQKSCWDLELVAVHVALASDFSFDHLHPPKIYWG